MRKCVCICVNWSNNIADANQQQQQQQYQEQQRPTLMKTNYNNDRTAAKYTATYIQYYCCCLVSLSDWTQKRKKHTTKRTNEQSVVAWNQREGSLANSFITCFMVVTYRSKSNTVHIYFDLTSEKFFFSIFTRAASVYQTKFNSISIQFFDQYLSLPSCVQIIVTFVTSPFQSNKIHKKNCINVSFHCQWDIRLNRSKKNTIQNRIRTIKTTGTL